MCSISVVMAIRALFPPFSITGTHTPLSALFTTWGVSSPYKGKGEMV